MLTNCFAASDGKDNPHDGVGCYLPSDKSDGKKADGKKVDSKETDGKIVDGKETDGKIADGKETNGKIVDGKETIANRNLSAGILTLWRITFSSWDSQRRFFLLPSDLSDGKENPLYVSQCNQNTCNCKIYSPFLLFIEYIKVSFGRSLKILKC